MKKKFTILFMLLTSSVTITTAQFRLLRSIDEIEISVGPSLESLRGREDSENNVTKIGYSSYLKASWNLSEKSSLKVGVGYHRKGQNRESTVTYFDDATQQLQRGNYSSEWNLDYIVIPLTYCFVPFSSKIPLSFEGGLFVASLNKATSITKNLYNGTVLKIVSKDELENYDMGVVMSISYLLFSIKEYNLSIGFIYELGFIDISKPSLSTVYHTLKSNSLNFSIGLSKKHKQTKKL